MSKPNIPNILSCEHMFFNKISTLSDWCGGRMRKLPEFATLSVDRQTLNAHKKRAGKVVSPSRSLCYFPYTDCVRTLNLRLRGRWCSHPIQNPHLVPSKSNITKQEPRPKFTQFKTISRFIFPSLFLIPSPFILRFIFPPLFPFFGSPTHWTEPNPNPS